jgi:hypothetical protein
MMIYLWQRCYQNNHDHPVELELYTQFNYSISITQLQVDLIPPLKILPNYPDDNKPSQIRNCLPFQNQSRRKKHAYQNTSFCSHTQYIPVFKNLHNYLLMIVILIWVLFSKFIQLSQTFPSICLLINIFKLMLNLIF